MENKRKEIAEEFVQKQAEWNLMPRYKKIKTCLICK